MDDFSAYALTGAWVFATLASLFGWLHWRHRDAGAGWFFVAFAAAALLYLFDEHLRPVGKLVDPASSVIAAGAFAAFTAGLFEHLGLQGRRRLRWWCAALAGPLVMAFGQWLVPMPRLVGFGVVAATMTVLAWPTLQAGRDEPGVGHHIAAAALLSFPLLFALALSRTIDLATLRYVAIGPVAATGVTLIVISLSRARRRLQGELQAREQAESQLRALNQTLEQRVDERTEELREVVAGLEQFNRMVSHDLRGPLAGMSGLAPLVRLHYDEGRPERAGELLDLMGAQADQLAELVNNLLLLCRLSDGGLQRRRMPLDEPLQEALQTLALSHGEPLLAAVEAAALPDADVDPVLMRQVFVNLIGNGLKFTRHTPQPRVEVRAERAGSDIVLSVKDNGPGFDMSRAGDLFQPFRRLHAGYEGSGIGLTIVRRIVERHGGRAWAEGRPGGGATFYVSLPA
jgi:signal transduction histidine kinase